MTKSQIDNLNLLPEEKDIDHIEVPIDTNLGKYRFTESLRREGFNAALSEVRTRLEAADLVEVGEVRALIENLQKPSYEEGGFRKDVRVAERLGKSVVLKGPIAQARSDGYKVALQNVLESLFALSSHPHNTE